MQARSLYLFKSVACSNTVYYEELEHTKIFLGLAQKHLNEFLTIHEYMLTKDGWMFLARLKSKNQILKAYANKRKKLNKSPKDIPVWQIVSEQIRLFLSSYVTKYNNSTGREGVLVKRPYQRFYFESKQEAMSIIQRIRRRVIGIQQTNKKYRAKRGHYRIPKTLGKGSIYLSSGRSKRGAGKVWNRLELTVIQLLKSKVLAEMLNKAVKQTKTLHNSPIPDF